MNNTNRNTKNGTDDRDWLDQCQRLGVDPAAAMEASLASPDLPVLDGGAPGVTAWIDARTGATVEVVPFDGEAF